MLIGISPGAMGFLRHEELNEFDELDLFDVWQI